MFEYHFEEEGILVIEKTRTTFNPSFTVEDTLFITFVLAILHPYSRSFVNSLCYFFLICPSAYQLTEYNLNFLSQTNNSRYIVA